MQWFNLGQLNDCNKMLFPTYCIVTICSVKSLKSLFILLQCNTSLSKIMLHIQFNNCSLCDGWVEFEKETGLSVLSCSVHMKSVIKQGFFDEFAFDNEVLKTFVEFRIY